jgi:hypothetical protein
VSADWDVTWSEIESIRRLARRLEFELKQYILTLVSRVWGAQKHEMYIRRRQAGSGTEQFEIDDALDTFVMFGETSGMRWS